MIIDRLDEEFLLFAIHHDGTWVSRRHGSVRHGMAAAWILEMLRDGKVRQVDRKLVSKSKTPMDDEAIDPLLELIYRGRKDKTVTQWVRVFSRRAPALIPAVARRLRGRGYIDIVQDAKGKLRYPMHRPESRKDLRQHLWQVMQGDTERDLRSLDLLCVLGAAGMTEEVFGRSRRLEAEERILDMIQYDPHLLHMWRAVRAVRGWGVLARSPPFEVPEVHFQSLGQATHVRRRPSRQAMPPWQPPVDDTS